MRCLIRLILAFAVGGIIGLCLAVTILVVLGRLLG